MDSADLMIGKARAQIARIFRAHPPYLRFYSSSEEDTGDADAVADILCDYLKRNTTSFDLIYDANSPESTTFVTFDYNKGVVVPSAREFICFLEDGCLPLPPKTRAIKTKCIRVDYNVSVNIHKLARHVQTILTLSHI
jgi:hypothetical protein